MSLTRKYTRSYDLEWRFIFNVVIMLCPKEGDLISAASVDVCSFVERYNNTLSVGQEAVLLIKYKDTSLLNTLRTFLSWLPVHFEKHGDPGRHSF